MIIFDGPVTPDALTAFIREVPTPSDFALSRLMPIRYFDRNSIDFSELTRTNRTARFRTFDGRIHVSERDAGMTRAVKLPPLSSSIGVGELERLQLEFARTGGGNNAAMANAIYDDGANLTREVQARVELAWGDVFTDGKLTMSLDDEPLLDADYGVPVSHLVAPATPWTTTATATALTDLMGFVDTYVATNGFPPGAILLSKRVTRLLQRNTEIINAVAGAQTGRTRVTLPELGDQFDAEGIPRLLAPYDTKVDVDGIVTSVIPDNRVIFLPPNVADLGYMAYGVSATALELVNSSAVDFAFEEAPGIVGVVEKIGPPYRHTTFVDAVGMPVLANPKRLLVAVVA